MKVRTGDVPQTLGGRLRRVRGSASQKDFAAEIGVGLSAYQYYERDERQPDAELLACLVRGGWSANWLLAGLEPERLSEIAEKPTNSQIFRESSLRMALAAVGSALSHPGLSDDDKVDLVLSAYKVINATTSDPASVKKDLLNTEC